MMRRLATPMISWEFSAMFQTLFVNPAMYDKWY
jgi:hypothetical protein